MFRARAGGGAPAAGAHHGDRGTGRGKQQGQRKRALKGGEGASQAPAGYGESAAGTGNFGVVAETGEASPTGPHRVPIRAHRDEALDTRASHLGHHLRGGRGVVARPKVVAEGRRGHVRRAHHVQPNRDGVHSLGEAIGPAQRVHPVRLVHVGRLPNSGNECAGHVSRQRNVQWCGVLPDHVVGELWGSCGKGDIGGHTRSSVLFASLVGFTRCSVQPGGWVRGHRLSLQIRTSTFPFFFVA